MGIHTAKGTDLHFDVTDQGLPGVGVHVAQVRSITGPTIKPKIVDVTSHDTVGFWARKLTVLIEPGDLSFEINWDVCEPSHAFTSNQSLWFAMVGNQAVPNSGLARTTLELEFPFGAGHLLFRGYVAQHEFTVPVDNVLAAKIQLAITDQVETLPPTKPPICP